MIINLKSQTEMSAFYVVYNGSTFLERDGWYGTSHLLEHLKFKVLDHLEDSFYRDGLNVNAYTSDSNIVFYMTGIDEKVNKWKYKFLELLSKFEVTEEEFNNEVSIVMEEYQDSFNDQHSSHYMNLFRKLFNHYSPIGLREDLEKLEYSEIFKIHDHIYSAPSKIINVSKHNDFIGEIKPSIIGVDKVFEFGNYKTPLELSNTFNDKSSIIMLSPMITEDLSYVNYINSMLGMGLTSPLYQEIREKNGLAYGVWCYKNDLNRSSMVNISTQTSNRNVDKVLDLTKNIITNPDTFLTKDRFDIVNDYYRVNKVKSEINRYDNVNRWITDNINDSIVDILDIVSMDKIREVYDKYYNFDNFYISIDKKEFQ